VVGQRHVTRTLRNAIASGQVAHAYLLAGPRGIGKTSIARLIAKAVNCPRAADGEPCDTCPACASIREGRFLDLIEIDAASNRGIDEMRDLRDKVRFAPSEGQYKVYVIDEAHQLTSEAFNALLKTLEEPPAHAIFVLATTESQKIPATIVSRTQRFDLRRIAHQEMVAHLAKIATAEKLTAEAKALEAIARHAQGSLRDGESILDQLASFSDGGKVSLKDVDDLLGTSDWEDVAELFDAFAADDGIRAVTLVGRLVDEGRDLHLFARRAIEHVRALVLVRYTGKAPEILGEEAAARIKEQAPKLAPDRLARIAKRLVEAEQQLRTGEGTPLPLELAVLELTAADAPVGARAGDAPAGGRSPSPARSSLPASSAPATPKSDASGRVPGPLPRVRGAPPPATSPALAPTPSGAGTPRSGASAVRAPITAGTSPARAGAATATAIRIEAVRQAWEVVLERTREKSMGNAAQLQCAEPTTVEGGVIVLAFANEFARGWMDQRRTELEREMSSILGADVRVRCVKQTPREAPPATDDPMLRAALETFRRPERILEVE